MAVERRLNCSPEQVFAVLRRLALQAEGRDGGRDAGLSG